MSDLIRLVVLLLVPLVTSLLIAKTARQAPRSRRNADDTPLPLAELSH